MRREEEEGRASYSGILILSGRTYLCKFVSGKKARCAKRSGRCARARVLASPSPSVFLARKYSYGEDEKGARATGTKGTSVVGDECRKQPTRCPILNEGVVSREDSISYSTIDRLSIGSASRKLAVPTREPWRAHI